jgi:hypothetical protein
MVREGDRWRFAWCAGGILLSAKIIRRIDVEAKNVVFFNPFLLVQSI